MRDGTTVTLDSNINSTWANEAWISPNGTKIALLKHGNPGTAALYVVAGIAPPTINDLRNKVSVCVSDKGIANSLNAKIDAQQWNAFINEVEAQSGKKISQACADDLIGIASYFLNTAPKAK
jgi:hypothetical protein